MLVWIPLGFAILVAALSTDDPLAGALLANVFHAIGAIVGLLYALGLESRPAGGGVRL
jgi:hypothetical protein